MSETSKPKSSGIPGTEESTQQKYMQAGLHLVKVKEIVEAVNSKTNEKMFDGNGNPGIEIVFTNKEGEEIKGLYFYSTLPFDHPDRKDDKKRCKSEFRLHQLKQAMGFGVKPIPADKAKTVKFWLVVKLQDIVDKENNPLYGDNGKPRTWHVVGDAFPIEKDEAGNVKRPKLKGDPQTDPNNFMTGVFHEYKVDTKAPAPEPKAEEFEPAPQDISTPADETPATIPSGEAPTKPGEDW